MWLKVQSVSSNLVCPLPEHGELCVKGLPVTDRSHITHTNPVLALVRLLPHRAGWSDMCLAVCWCWHDALVGVAQSSLSLKSQQPATAAHSRTCQKGDLLYAASGLQHLAAVIYIKGYSQRASSSVIPTAAEVAAGELTQLLGWYCCSTIPSDSTI
jgi:hypothetical protein